MNWANINWVDIILLIFLIKSALQGFYRGFILSAFKTIGVLVALFMGIFYRDTAVDLLNTHFAMDKLVRGLITAPAKANNEYLEVISINSIVQLALSALGFFAIFLAVQIVFSIIAYFINGLIRISNLTLVNRLMGTIFGIARSALLLSLLSSVLSPFLMAFPGSALERGISSSWILNHLRFLDFISPIVVKLI